LLPLQHDADGRSVEFETEAFAIADVAKFTLDLPCTVAHSDKRFGAAAAVTAAAKTCASQRLLNQPNPGREDKSDIAAIKAESRTVVRPVNSLRRRVANQCRRSDSGAPGSYPQPHREADVTDLLIWWWRTESRTHQNRVSIGSLKKKKKYKLTNSPVIDLRPRYVISQKEECIVELRLVQT
jgi:hypothetical protein